MSRKMLDLFRKNPKQVLTRGQLLEKLWDEETAERCYLEADDNEKALARLSAMGYQARRQDGGIRVMSDVDLMRVCEDFRENGIYLTKHIHDSLDLEDYFMKLPEGN